jgi:hypothetical protein
MTVFTVVVELLHEIGRDVGPEDWCKAAHPNNSAADVHQLDHHDFHPSLRPRVRAPGATVHTPSSGSVSNWSSISDNIININK